jgi:hypothetical protein
MLVGIGLIGFGKWAALGQSEPPKVPSPIRMQGSPLQLVLTKTQESPRPLFRAELCNVGKRPLVLNLGFMFPNGKQYPEAIHLILTNANGKTLLLSTMLGVIGGLAETFVVPLPAGATFALPIDLDDYSAPDASKADLPPGSYTLQVHYATPDLPQRSKPSFFWVGTADSNVVQFVVKAQ